MAYNYEFSLEDMKEVEDQSWKKENLDEKLKEDDLGKVICFL